MTDDRRIIAEYRENVIAMHTLSHQLAWNQRHGLPLMELPELLEELKERVLRFDELLNRIPDRMARIVLRCRYALGMNASDTAVFTKLSCNTVSKIVTGALHQIAG